MPFFENFDINDKPAKLKEEHLLFLDKLRESGQTNMWGATPFLAEIFGLRDNLNEKEQGEILLYWMGSFGERHSNN